MIVHMINAYDDPSENGTVVLDSTNAANGDIMTAYYYDVSYVYIKFIKIDRKFSLKFQ